MRKEMALFADINEREQNKGLPQLPLSIQIDLEVKWIKVCNWRRTISKSVH
jgi:hypothetical protein